MDNDNKSSDYNVEMTTVAPVSLIPTVLAPVEPDQATPALQTQLPDPYAKWRLNAQASVLQKQLAQHYDQLRQNPNGTFQYSLWNPPANYVETVAVANPGATAQIQAVMAGWSPLSSPSPTVMLPPHGAQPTAAGAGGTTFALPPAPPKDNLTNEVALHNKIMLDAGLPVGRDLLAKFSQLHKCRVLATMLLVAVVLWYFVMASIYLLSSYATHSVIGTCIAVKVPSTQEWCKQLECQPDYLVVDYYNMCNDKHTIQMFAADNPVISKSSANSAILARIPRAVTPSATTAAPATLSSPAEALAIDDLLSLQPRFPCTMVYYKTSSNCDLQEIRLNAAAFDQKTALLIGGVIWLVTFAAITSALSCGLFGILIKWGRLVALIDVSDRIKAHYRSEKTAAFVAKYNEKRMEDGLSGPIKSSDLIDSAESSDSDDDDSQGCC
jgi:hypothetical protein